MFKRLLWTLGYCDLVWVYNPYYTDTPRLLILLCTADETKYVDLYGFGLYGLYLRLNTDGSTGTINTHSAYVWLKYTPGNMPRQPSNKLKWCKFDKER